MTANGASAAAADAALRFAEIIAARLCHDVSGPLSIVGNAAELSRLEAEAGNAAGGGGEAMAMMREGAEAIAARIHLQRAIFTASTTPLVAQDIARLAGGVVGGGRAELNLAGLAPATVFDPASGRAVLAALMVAGEALKRGGTIACHGGTEDVAFAVAGTNAAWPPSLTTVLGGADPVAAAIAGGSRELMGPMAVLLAREAGYTPSLLMGAGVPLLRFARG
ncbi:histidine phosphotransferase family protein [Elioraea sp.]|uniref:histidine phosphotransferase family protein n=1 Tax=Elioraea sp. TaxID=2185103 RepID=UPI0025B8E910|nr:histidine phosphotransferase family protein [Elioraea sp.]